MPTLRAIVDDWYDKAWGAHKSGKKGLLPELERSPLMWRSSSPWKCEAGDIHFSNTKESSYTSKLPRLDTRNLEQSWRSIRLGLFSRSIAGEEQLNPLIPRMNSKNVIKRIRARVKSSGLKASMVVKRELAAVADNTLFITGTLEDGAPLCAAVWFERATAAWKLQSWCGIVVRDITNHPSLHGLYEHPSALTLDNGLKSLSFGEPMLIESSVVVMGSATTMPVLAGAHYYVGFSFGPNLQRAVRKRTPLVLIGNQMNASAWRSTPFDLSFTDLELRDCTLLIKTRQLDDGGTLVWDSRCYLQGRGLGGQRYRTELGSDNCILRWNLQLNASLDYDPADVDETDSPQNAELAGAEEDFFLDSPATYPPLQKLERYDAWLGGAAWRSGDITSAIYGSLAEAQFLHLQFGIALTSLDTTDAALVFRGTPTVNRPSDDFTWHRSLFRVAVGQPFNSGQRRISHESHIRIMAGDIPCEGFFEPQEDKPILNLRPARDTDIPRFAAGLKVDIPIDTLPAVDQFTLRFNLISGRGQVIASNDGDFQLLDPLEEP